MLRSKFFDPEEVEAIVRDYRSASLSGAEVAMMALAEKVVLNAYKGTEDDIEGLRQHGFTDAEILDMILAASARAFFSKVLDATGAEPDEVYLNLEEGLREAAVVGR